MESDLEPQVDHPNKGKLKRGPTRADVLKM